VIYADLRSMMNIDRIQEDTYTELQI